MSICEFPQKWPQEGAVSNVRRCYGECKGDGGKTQCRKTGRSFASLDHGSRSTRFTGSTGNQHRSLRFGESVAVTFPVGSCKGTPICTGSHPGWFPPRDRGFRDRKNAPPGWRQETGSDSGHCCGGGQSTGRTVEKSVARYQANPNVEFAEPDFYRVLIIPDEGTDPGPEG